MSDRINRKGFVFYLTIAVALAIALELVLPLSPLSGRTGSVGGCVAVVTLGGIKRMHDLGRDYWWGVVPMAALVLFLTGVIEGGSTTLIVIAGLLSLPCLALLFVLPGQPGANRWGLPPGKGLFGGGV